jgi:dihydroorotate dehydrogenase (fumarate)
MTGSITMDLRTEFVGLELKNPIVPSASPLSRSVDMARRLEDQGAAAIIMYSLFEEAVVAEDERLVRFLNEQESGFGEAQHFLPTHHEIDSALDHYLDNLTRLKEALDIPVIASLNGASDGGWIKHAMSLQAAGADALELNVYFVAADLDQPGGQVERRYLELLADLREQVNLPINMKLSPFFSSMGHLVKEIDVIGANGVSLFNRFYQPDIDVDGLRLNHRLNLSTSADALLTMHWISILHGKVELTLGATTGIHTAEDALKMLLAGADVTHLCSALLKRGPRVISEILQGIEHWMEEKGFESLDEFKGMLSQLSIPNSSTFERINYMKSLDSYVLDRSVFD